MEMPICASNIVQQQACTDRGLYYTEGKVFPRNKYIAKQIILNIDDRIQVERILNIEKLMDMTIQNTCAKHGESWSHKITRILRNMISRFE